MVQSLLLSQYSPLLPVLFQTTRMPLMRAITSLILIAVLSGCSKQSETLPLSSTMNYYPLQIGKHFIYRLDSTLYLSFGSSVIIKSYLAKDSIVNIFQDNNGRTSYTVYRYTTDTLLRNAWQYKSAYFITPANKSVELVDDNNYRFIKLKEPVSEGYSWNGNAYVDAVYELSISYLYNWNYTYQNVNLSYTTPAGTFDSTVTVLQQDNTFPEGDFNPAYYQQRNYSVEVYAKGVGLIYKDFLHWTWQTDPPPAHYDDGSYGIRLSLIDHN